MKIPDTEGVVSKGGNRKKPFRKGKTENDIFSVSDRIFQRGVLFGFLGEKHIDSDDARPVFFQIVYNPSIIRPFKILKSSESLGVGKRFIVDSDDGDIFIGSVVFPVSGKKNVFYTEVRFLDENSGEVPDNRKAFHTHDSNQQDDENGKDSGNDSLVVNDFFKIHRGGNDRLLGKVF